ncbi:hypothetical protein HW115_16705 [Verrucomicrobiaceae bacterium N1E253]|uniref:Uncharacterized protein n=1 Tax=Oceaniferula marina TaxID=2748318 RepID=A0A851GQ73_9BACT|nr:hypothetical protein [Oceaniferula marina]NWK57265.1 hypothetical protein [Oceaniferula marina]
MAAEETWRRIAKHTSRKVNRAWWLQSLATPLMACSLVLSCAILILRTLPNSPAPIHLGTISLAILTLVTVMCWLIARRRFESPADSMIRLEAAMHLKNALTAAEHGVSPWPAPPAQIHDGIQWHWKRLLTPLVGSTLLVACGFLIPIQAKTDKQQIIQEPAAWNELNSSLNRLDREQLADEDYLDEMRKKLEQLRQENPDSWFSHSSLEATDNLTQNHQSNQEQLGNSLNQAERSLNGLQHQASQLNQKQQQQLLNNYQQAIKNIKQGAMQPNEELMKQLEKIDPGQLKELSPEQLDQIRENMRRHAQGLKQPGQEGEKNWGEQQQGEGEGEGDENGNQGGRGGVGRGPGTAPHVLGDPHQDTGTGKHEGLQSNDPSQSLPGDLLQTSDAQHNVDQSSKGPSAGGATQHQGQGGDRVWKSSLLPNEKKALKKFFE